MKTIEQYIETEMSGKIARKRNSPLPALLVLAVGVGMWILLCTVSMGDNLSATCLTAALIGTALGIILTAMNLTGAMTHFEYLPTHSRMRDRKVYVSEEDYKSIVQALAANCQPPATMRRVVSSNYAVRVVVSSDSRCALMQAMRDEGGRFEPATEVRLVNGPSATSLINLTK